MSEKRKEKCHNINNAVKHWEKRLSILSAENKCFWECVSRKSRMFIKVFLCEHYIHNQCFFCHAILATKGVAYMSPFQKVITINLSPSPLTYRNCIRTSNIWVIIHLMRTQRRSLPLIFPLQDYEELLIQKRQHHKPP